MADITTYTRFNPDLVHWTRWQPEILQQQMAESKMIWPFMFGVTIQGFQIGQWPVIRLGGIDTTIHGRKHREGDSPTEIFIPDKVEFADPTLDFITQRGDYRLEKWFETVIRIIMKQYNYSQLPDRFQPEELEQVVGLRRDIMVHFLDIDLSSVRSLLLKKALPTKHSLTELDSLTSGMVKTMLTFDVLRSEHGI